jgi:hypothetical protein
MPEVVVLPQPPLRSCTDFGVEQTFSCLLTLCGRPSWSGSAFHADAATLSSKAIKAECIISWRKVKFASSALVFYEFSKVCPPLVQMKGDSLPLSVIPAARPCFAMMVAAMVTGCLDNRYQVGLPRGMLGL